MTIKKINLIIFRFPYESAVGMGGEEKHVLMLAEGLIEEGHTVFLSTSCSCLLNVSKEKKLPHQKIWGGLDIVSLKAIFIFPITAWFIFLRLAAHLLYQRVFRGANAVYFLTLNEKILLTPLARLLGMKVLWGQHTKIGRWLTLNPFRLFYLICSLFATVIVPSEDMKKQFVALGVREKNIEVIYNAIDPTKFKKILSLHKLDEQMKAILGQDFSVKKGGNDVFIGTVARLSREKGLMYLIEAADLVLAEFPHAHFFVVGEGEEREKLQNYIEEKHISDRFFLLGYQDEAFLNAFLEWIDIFVLPSDYESFGISVLEAMYFRKSVVATSVGGVKEIIQHNKEGILVAPKSPVEMSQAINNIISDDALRMRIQVAGNKKVREEFNTEKMLRRFDDVLHE